MSYTYNLGRVAINLRGDYNSATAYSPLDAVFHLGGAYLCLSACTGIDPATGAQHAAYWMPWSRGVQSIITEYDAGLVTMTVYLSDGTSRSISYPATQVGDLSITSAKLAGSAVTAAKLANGAVSSNKLADGSVTAEKIAAPIPTGKGGTGATSGSAGLKNLLAAGATVLSHHQYGSALPASGEEGQIFFLLDA